jgi:hypothetical protein
MLANQSSGFKVKQAAGGTAQHAGNNASLIQLQHQPALIQSLRL